jgi:3-hydroxybutyryl-CoA dehydratase
MTLAKTLATLNNYFDDLAVGDRFVSRARTVTEADIALFSGLSGDYHPLHTDEVYARTGPFGRRIAQGCLTLSLATGLEFSPMGSNESRVIAIYGMDRVRFVKPVFIGDTIRLEGEVTALEDRGDASGVVIAHHEIKNERGETVAVLDKRTLHRKRPPD